MASKTVVQEVQEQMRDLTAKKTAELDAIRQKQTEAQTQKEAAELAIKDATEKMDLEAYEEAKQAKHKAQTALDMYAGKYKQITAQEYISEAESDKVIDRLLAYEDELAEGFKKKAAEALKALADMVQEYKDEVAEAEQTIGTWTATIRANYSTRGQTYRTDKFTGLQTDRAEKPVPVHSLTYDGCKEYKCLRNFLTSNKDLYNA